MNWFYEKFDFVNIADCLDGENFLGGEVILHSIIGHLGKYGDGGCALGLLDQQVIW